jgi:glucosyltransferase
MARVYLHMVEQVRPHLIHAHFGWAGADSVLAADRLQVPLLVSFHGTDLLRYPELPDWRGAYRRMLRHVPQATVASRFLEDRLRSLGYEGRVEVLPPGVRLEHFPYRGPREDGGELRLAFIGRLIDWKGLDVLLRALPLVRSAPAPRLSVVGDGPERAAAERLAEGLSLRDRVEFHGALHHDGVVEVLRGADVAVSPSRQLPDGQVEGAGLIPREAQALGLQVAVTTAGGLPEGLPPERRHEAVPWDDPEALAARIDELWSVRERWPERARRGREFVEREFSWRILGRRLSEIYRYVLGRQRP